MLMDDRKRLLMALFHDTADLSVYLSGNVLAESAGMGKIPTDKYLVRIVSERNESDLIRHSVFRDHGSGNGRGPLDVVGGPGGNIPEDDLLGRPAAPIPVGMMLIV